MTVIPKLDSEGMVLIPLDQDSASRIITYSGHSINPLKPSRGDIYIEDIAHSLSNQCRFTGHVSTFYSTGQHCVLASYLVPGEFALEALLHDASEAYLSDIARPVKHAAGFGEVYRACEHTLEKVIAEKFGLPESMSPEVKEADTIMLFTEMRDLMPNDPPDGAETLDTEIDPWLPEKAERSFLARYHALTRA